MHGASRVTGRRDTVTSRMARMDETYLGRRLLDFVLSLHSRCEARCSPRMTGYRVVTGGHPLRCDRRGIRSHTTAPCAVGNPDLHILLSQMNEPHILTVLPNVQGAGR